MGNTKFEYIRENKNMIRIIPKMGKLPKLEEYIEEARILLKNESEVNEEDQLKDPSSLDFLDTLGLIQEFKEDFDNKVKTIVFSYKTCDIEVNADNINKIPNIIQKVNEQQKHMTAVREAVEELLER